LFDHSSVVGVDLKDLQEVVQVLSAIDGVEFVSCSKTRSNNNAYGLRYVRVED